jgi:hypothetical protein
METTTKTRFTAPGMPFQSVERGQTVIGPSLAGKLAIVLMALLGAILFAGILVVITAAFLVAILAAVCVVAIRAAFHSLVPRSRNHRVDGGGFRPTAVIETTAKAIRNAPPKPRP